jgi:hypothetical protein
VQVDGIGYGPIDGSFLPNPVDVAWSNANRLTEDSQILAWTAATVTPETDQTTKIEILNGSDRAVIDTFSSLTGTSYSLDLTPYDTPYGSYDGIIVRVTSERDGFESLQGHEITIVLGGGPITDILLSEDTTTTIAEVDSAIGTLSTVGGVSPYTYEIVEEEAS